MKKRLAENGYTEAEFKKRMIEGAVRLYRRLSGKKNNAELFTKGAVRFISEQPLSL